jgi:hypothetical protein
MAVFDIRFGDSLKLMLAGAAAGVIGAWFFLSDFRLRGVPTNIPGVQSAGEAEYFGGEGEYESFYGELGPAGNPDNQLRYMPPPPEQPIDARLAVQPGGMGSSMTSAGSADNQVRFIPPIGRGDPPFGFNLNPEGIQWRGAMWNTIGSFPAWAARDKAPIPVQPRVLVQVDNIHWS